MGNVVLYSLQPPKFTKIPCGINLKEIKMFFWKHFGKGNWITTRNACVIYPLNYSPVRTKRDIYLRL